MTLESKMADSLHPKLIDYRPFASYPLRIQSGRTLSVADESHSGSSIQPPVIETGKCRYPTYDGACQSRMRISDFIGKFIDIYI